uniref:Uncharacterized protein n=1 Tax=Arundo donax TaxID=35708 RepID=A0A0A9BVJ4_ARUDO
MSLYHLSIPKVIIRTTIQGKCG